MSYPLAIATGNAVIAAALEWDEANTAHLVHVPFEPLAVWQRLLDAETALRYAVAAHRAVTAIEHVQGPDIDADT